MRSTDASAAGVDDRSTRARIRDAAIGCFADAGLRGTGVRTIAAAAGVSPGLVIHHFGSKAGLRRECDAYVARQIHDRESVAMGNGGLTDPLAVVRSLGEDPPVLRYLARTLVDDSPEAAALVDQLVTVSADLTRQAVDEGIVNPAPDEYARSVVLSLWSFGTLVMHTHLERLLGVDLLGDPSRATRYIGAAVRILCDPLFSEDTTRQLLDAFPAAHDERSRSTTA